MSTENDPAVAPADVPTAPAARSMQADGGESSQAVSARLTRVASPPVLALAVLVLAGAAFAIMHVAAPVFNPIILSVFIVTLTLPALKWLKRRGVKQGIALLILGGALLLFGAGVVLFGWLYITRLETGLEQYSENLDAAVEIARHQVGRGNVDLGLGRRHAVTGAEGVDAGMLQEAADNRLDPDILG